MNVKLGLPIVEGVYKLYQDPKKWTTGADGRNSEGHRVSPTDESACQWCLRGAITCIAFKRHSRSLSRAEEAVEAARAIVRHYAQKVYFSAGIAGMNDLRGFDFVRGVLKASIKNAKRRKK